MSWTHRQRVMAALNHEEADRVPIDFGSAGPTAIVAEAYDNLMRHLGFSQKAEVLQELKVQKGLLKKTESKSDYQKCTNNHLSNRTWLLNRKFLLDLRQNQNYRK